MTAFVCEGLRKRFGRREVLRGLDLRVSPGEVVALVGANGAGKSTLLRLAGGLLLPCAGRLSVLGLDPEQARRAHLVGWAASGEGSFTRRLPLHTNLLHFARLCGLSRRAARHRIAGLADRLGFSSHLDETVECCSTGVLQRAAIARARLHAPRLLLLDEPLRGVDAASAPGLARALSRTRRDESILWVSHDRGEVASVADRVVRLEGGVAVGGAAVHAA